jgi:hypothetical protein
MLRQIRLCCVKLGYARFMYLMLRGLIMVGHNSLNLTSLSLLYSFVNILYIWTLFNAEHVLTRMDTPSNAL